MRIIDIKVNRFSGLPICSIFIILNQCFWKIFYILYRMFKNGKIQCLNLKTMIMINKRSVRIKVKFNVKMGNYFMYVPITLTMTYDFCTRSRRFLFVLSTYHLCSTHYIYREIEKIKNLNRSRSSSDGDQTRRIHTMGTVW